MKCLETEVSPRQPLVTERTSQANILMQSLHDLRWNTVSASRRWKDYIMEHILFLVWAWYFLFYTTASVVSRNFIHSSKLDSTCYPIEWVMVQAIYSRFGVNFQCINLNSYSWWQIIKAILKCSLVSRPLPQGVWRWGYTWHTHIAI